TGAFSFEIDTTKRTRIIVKAYNFEPEYVTLHKGYNPQQELVVVMSPLNNSTHYVYDDVNVYSNKGDRRETGKITFDTKDLLLSPDPSGGVEGKIKILVGSSNETT